MIKIPIFSPSQIQRDTFKEKVSLSKKKKQ